jgi:hypothetical protein
VIFPIDTTTHNSLTQKKLKRITLFEGTIRIVRYVRRLNGRRSEICNQLNSRKSVNKIVRAPKKRIVSKNLLGPLEKSDLMI